jgi:hypothetical protein
MTCVGLKIHFLRLKMSFCWTKIVTLNPLKMSELLKNNTFLKKNLLKSNRFLATRFCIENCSRFCPQSVPDGGGSTKFSWLADAFTMDEFEGALDQCNNSAPGLAGIKFIMFKFLPEEAKQYLLRIFIKIMSTDMIPES